MYQNVQPLKKTKNLTFTVNTGFHYAASENFCPVFLQELPEIAREYFICFPANQKDLPHVLLGFEQNKNMYVTGDGAWQADYIPAHIRRYPFALAILEDKNQIIAADMDAPHFNRADGKSLFRSDGQPTESLNNRINFLKALEKQRAATQKATKQLEEAGLFKMEQMTVKTENKAIATVGGIRMIDEKKLKNCHLKAGDALQLAYAHVLSKASLRFGLLSGRKAYMDNKKNSAPTPDIDSLFGNDDIFKF